MASQCYLKHGSNTVAVSPAIPNTKHLVHIPQSVTVANQMQQQQHLIQSTIQLKPIQLKQPGGMHQQHNSFHLHHPYYQHSVSTLASAPTLSHSHTHSNYIYTHGHSHGHNVHSVPVYAINQNSNFSAASSSTGGGTASSHAPTQQSNTTGSSLSPPNASANARNISSVVSNSTGNDICKLKTQTTTRSCINNGGAKKQKDEPILTKFQQAERFNFATTHMLWDEKQWKRVIFHDERRFNLDGPDGFSYYFHDLRNFERTLSQRPRGNSVFIQVIITSGGPIHLEISTTKQKPESCVEIILRERVNIVTVLGENQDFIVQDHNWLTNALTSTQELLSTESIKTQKWPTIAHDLNIMENIWGWLIREVYDGGRKFSRKDDLIFRIREAWARLSLDLLNNLYSTLPERIMELFYTRGTYTNC